jgi:hypothetical protein
MALHGFVAKSLKSRAFATVGLQSFLVDRVGKRLAATTGAIFATRGFDCRRGSMANCSRGQAANRQSPIANHQSPVANHQSPVARRQCRHPRQKLSLNQVTDSGHRDARRLASLAAPKFLYMPQRSAGVCTGASHSASIEGSAAQTVIEQPAISSDVTYDPVR